MADSPVRQLSGFANHNNAIFMQRYMLLVGGCEIHNWKKGTAPAGLQQCTVGSPGFGHCSCPCGKSSNGSLDVENVSAIEPGKCGVPLNDSSLPMVYGNAVFVFDVQEERFGTVSVSALHDPDLLPAGCGPFPFNVASPMVAVAQDQVAVVGGEANTRQIGATLYQHDSQLAVIGQITEL